ncbi:glutamate synthase large subunit [Desulfovibrio sp. OttesenSCG-928-G15]|nr:glutamate synthase large subunit [Desulfovibrio sp. OttesenSCG-928-G15]
MQTNLYNSLYTPEEHDACGVGFLARLDGIPTHSIVEDAVQALARMAHRGGSGFGPEHPDGAGILVPLPVDFIRKTWQPVCGEVPRTFALGQFFMPRDVADRTHIEEKVATIFAEHRLRVLGWRDVPVRKAILGEHAAKTCPVFRQCLAAPTETLLAELQPIADKPDSLGSTAGGTAQDHFERLLYIARRHLENSLRQTLPSATDTFHVASLSGSSVAYKGLLAGGQLSAFYPDLADRDFAVHFAILHERYSTNTQPAWRLAQPFHCLAHNGEINTLACNKVHMTIREPLLGSPLFGKNIRHLLPVLEPRGSDSAALDNCLEFLLRGGRSLPHAAMMLMPEPFGPAFAMGEDKRAFYEYHAALMEPWDGPSAMVFTDGRRQLGAMLDRNALRPCRYAETKDGLFVLASEAGVIDLPSSHIVQKGRLQPRRMLMVDFARHRVITDAECKNRVIYAKPYRHWVKEKGVTLRDLPLPSAVTAIADAAPFFPDEETTLRQQILFGYSREDIKDVLVPMARDVQEPTASMGMDRPLAVLSGRPQLLFSYFKQRFAQVTNPPIDPLREGLVMTLTGFAGKQRNLLEETPEQYTRLRLANPLLSTEDMLRLLASVHPAARVAVIPMLFAAQGDEPGTALEKGLQTMFRQAEEALSPSGRENGDQPATVLLLTDSGAGPDKAPIPSLLALSGLHHHLLRQGLRHACSLFVDTGEAREVMHVAQLLAFGASGVHPRLAFAAVSELAKQGALKKGATVARACTAYANAVHKGLLKTFSRMGISTLRSFMGGQAFEAVGLNPLLVDRYFSGVPSRLGGIGLEHIAKDTLARHAKAFGPQSAQAGTTEPLGPDGRYTYSPHGETHLWTPVAVRALHKAVREDDWESYQAYARVSDEQATKPVTLRSLLTFTAEKPVPLSEVEPVEAIVRRFVASAMSYGSISPEAHQAIAIACNRIGARSNCGEGGEAPERNTVRDDGSDARSRVRQIASGRFGVTADYLVNADEIQIKMAQGAKPGEGGQLPAHKVLPGIARVRHTIAGVTLISPPPHHDIYSIEDLAQLIYDVKSLNPEARVSVKLVAGTGIGTVASGVAKAGADTILVSGHDGGTGASPRTAIDHVGLPWEMGLSETQAALCANGLRNTVRLQVDGQLRTGKDLVVAAMMGAEEFGLGTGVLVALGCCLLRVCHLGTCPVGIAAQDPTLRARFKGSPEHVERYFRFLAQDMRRHMAALGFRTVDEMLGRADCLKRAAVPVGLSAEHTAKLQTLDLSALCIRSEVSPLNGPPHKAAESALHHSAYSALMPGIAARHPCRFEGRIANTDRAMGSHIAGVIARLYGEEGLPPGSVDMELTGSAGQSLGAFLARGMFLRVTGEANDYVGKGLSGGIIAIRPAHYQSGFQMSDFFSGRQVIAGNVALYGATSGEAYFSGSAGERFAVRNSGASAVVEGVGDHACEYMTGGVVVVLGSTGYNFAAGMSGGIAYVYDPSEQFQTRCNMDSVDLESVWQKDDIQLVRSLLSRHVRHTGSPLASALLADWQASLPLFLKVTPIEYRRVLERMKHGEGRQVESLAATEEVYSVSATAHPA